MIYSQSIFVSPKITPSRGSYMTPRGSKPREGPTRRGEERTGSICNGASALAHIHAGELCMGRGTGALPSPLPCLALQLMRADDKGNCTHLRSHPCSSSPSPSGLLWRSRKLSPHGCRGASARSKCPCYLALDVSEGSNLPQESEVAQLCLRAVM